MRRILFVGSFKNRAADGSVGGQMFACNTLLKSEIITQIFFVKIDSTARSVPAPAVFKRLPDVITRIFKFTYHLIFSKIDACLIFSSAKYSFLEKGLMALIGKVFDKKVIFAPRSGLIKDDINSSAFMRKYVILTMKHSDIILCQSEHWKEYYQSFTKLNHDKFMVVKNWLNVKEYANNAKPRDYIVNGRRSLLYLGWLEKHKGIIELLEACKILKRKNLDIEVIIYGSGSEMNFSKEFITIHELEHSVFLKGWADQNTKMKALQNADIFVLPSHREGFPNALLEAMASYLPVIATKVGSIPDLITDHVNGILVDAGSSEDLSLAIEELITDNTLYASLAAAGHDTVNKEHDVEKISKDLVRLLELEDRD